MKESDYRSQSFWHDTLPGSLDPRPSLTSDEQVDVAIVGAGFTGLWTAYYLKSLEPGIRVAIVEAEIAGFGASGRNGGWCVGTLAGIDDHLANPERRDGAIRLQRALFDTVDEVGDVCEREAIECHWAKGGYVCLASSEVYQQTLRADADHWRDLGFEEEEVRWLSAEESAARIRTRRNLGGLFMSACAAMHPARLVRGLAEAVERRGVAIYEHSPATALEPGCVVTPGGRLRADMVVRATEGYTPSLPGHERKLLPIHSIMVATEPLSETMWKEIGMPNRETFGDPRRMVTYGQRTADGRIAFGCRGAYFYGSGVRNRLAPDAAAFRTVQETLESLIPVTRDARITHRWAGALGIPRDWRPSVGVDRSSGLAWAGGYVGEGVAASNLAGRTLADLLLERDSELTSLPLVGPPFPSWEPEPLRWLGVALVQRLGAALDAAELEDRPAPRLREAIFHTFVRK
jgi:glycine/D-amino acid oxidase-like deaminating enzyme